MLVWMILPAWAMLGGTYGVFPDYSLGIGQFLVSQSQTHSLLRIYYNQWFTIHHTKSAAKAIYETFLPERGQRPKANGGA